MKAKRGRPRKYRKTARLTFTADERLVAKLKAAAGGNVSAFIVAVLRDRVGDERDG